MANKSEFDLTGIVGDITFSKTDVWVWVKLPHTQYEFIDDDSKMRLAAEMDVALAGLVTSEEKNIEVQICSTTLPFDALAWILRLNQINEAAGAPDANADYLTSMYEYVHARDFREKIVLLGVNVGKRYQYSSTKSVSGGFEFLNKISNLVAAAPVDDYMSDKELEYWKNIGHQVSYSLQNSRINAEPASAAEIAYATRKPFFPGMPSPTIEELSVGNSSKWGEGEITSLLDAQIENHPKFLKITQEIDGYTYVGYRAALCISKFPEILSFPDQEPWIHFASQLDFPVDFNLRFTLEPSRKVRKEVDKKLKEASDQAKNMTSAGGNTSIEVEEQLNLGVELDYALKKDTTPWVFGRYRIIVEATSEQELKERITEVIDHYRNLDIQVTWPTGDQLSLLKEQIPNDHVRILSYYQRQELSIISAGIPAGSGTAGDRIKYRADGPRGWIGPYVGITTGRVQSPVFFSIHSAIHTDNPGACSITGAPGSGKTFLGLTLAHQMASSGTWTIYIDPKADALGLVNLPGLEDATIIDLLNGQEGLLDPFSIGNDLAVQKSLAIEVITLLAGGNSNISNEQSVALAEAVTGITNLPTPSLAGVRDYLIASHNPAARALGSRLRLISELPIAKLCFSNGQGKRLQAESGLTIISVLGLDLPSDSLDRENYSNSNFLAVAIMYLLATLTKQLMLSRDKRHPKAIIIDEAWAITSTAQGAKLVAEVARMGRAHNTALLLISQNAEDFLDDRVKNSVSTKFAFRATGGEIDKVLDYLELEKTDLNREYVRQLESGECLMKDWSQRIARVYIDSWDEHRARTFESNPLARKQ